MTAMEFGCIVLLFLCLVCLGNAEVYIVTLKREHVVSYQGDLEGFTSTTTEFDENIDITSEFVTSYSHHLEKKHDMLLVLLFEPGNYKKIYSYKHLINGFAVHALPEQDEALRQTPGVKPVHRDWKVRRLTSHGAPYCSMAHRGWSRQGWRRRCDRLCGFWA